MTTQTTQLASTPEKAVYGALKKIGIEFIFQSSQLGGRNTRGGAVIDFILTELNIGLRVQGTYWHEGIVKQAHDRMQKEMLEGLPNLDVIVDIWEDDIENNLEQTMTLAIQGEEMIH
ncbi:hypothetical protein LCGC14_2595810 [marine sediment metagenome]|uniref:DUF559 domain-containing protein n=1 Tax=marine sediment metagenome TaxID=412755 RepID=A0A0F9AA76_9ZZZZ